MLLAPRAHIQRLLRENPHASVTAVVPGVSAAGLAWLHPLTTGRHVHLFVRDVTAKPTAGTLAENAAAAAFLARTDTEVRSPGRDAPRSAVWVAHPAGAGPASVLVGGSGLTSDGLSRADQIMALAADSEAYRLKMEAIQIFNSGVNAKSRLQAILAGAARTPPPATTPDPRRFDVAPVVEPSRRFPWG